MASPTRTLLVMVGPPGAGKTTAAKQIMALREKELRGEVLSVEHPDGELNKKGDGVKQVGAGVVLDGRGGLALLGRYASTHPEFWRTTRNKLMEGADRLAVGKEKGTWSQLLRPGVSPLADYRLLVIDSCDEATLHMNHLKQAQAAGWAIRVRELAVDCDTSRDRCMERNYAGRGSSVLEPRLTSMEREWNETFDERVAQLRTRFAVWDYAVRSQDEVLQEASTLLQNSGNSADSCRPMLTGAIAPASGPAAAPADSSVAEGSRKRSLVPANKAKKRPKQNQQNADSTQSDSAKVSKSLVDHALREAQTQFRIEVGASRWSLWNESTGTRVGKIETKAGKIKISCTLHGSQWAKTAATKVQATQFVRSLVSTCNIGADSSKKV